MVIPVLGWLQCIEQVASLAGIGQNHKKDRSDLSVCPEALQDLNANTADGSTVCWEIR